MSASRQRAIRQELTALDEGDLLAALSGHV
jgi:hypothetical protein